MIQLKNVSKFYDHEERSVCGFSKVNLKFHVGEFVMITGEAGSGKSALFHVMSGLDTYEEGEMYIAGKKTSHYTESDFEKYRRQYISNIFQNFNLVNSYTVYENIELVLLFYGSTGKDMEEKVLALIRKVGLMKYKNTKVSKLSDGQRKRVAIARALAKDTPIFLVEEPIRNLDSRSGKEIAELLRDISFDKLVIVVTSNSEQLESYVTRKVRMHDGKIWEDKILRKNEDVVYREKSKIERIGFGDKIRLGFWNILWKRSI